MTDALSQKPLRTAAANAARRAQSRYGPGVDRIVKSMSSLGATDEMMAMALGISKSTFHRWCEQHPTMRNQRDAGREHANANVTKALYRRAIGYKHKAVKIFDRRDGEPVKVPCIARYPPDTAAAIAWLTNRQPERWKNKHDVAVDLNVLARRALLEMATD